MAYEAIDRHAEILSKKQSRTLLSRWNAKEKYTFKEMKKCQIKQQMF